jgi:hypothetical protein
MSTYQGSPYIVWLGDLSDYPASPVINWAFYHTIDRKSYIYMGEAQGWSQMTEDGRPGSYAVTVYQNAETTPANPIGGSYDGYSHTAPDNWSNTPVAPTGSDRTWISVRTYRFTGVDWIGDAWSIPSYITGIDGAKGEPGNSWEGSFRSTVYRNADVEPSAPIGGSYDSDDGEVPPDDWTLAPVTHDFGEYTWESTTTYNWHKQLNVWLNEGWSRPAQHSGDKGDTPRKGDDYVDGSMVQLKKYLLDGQMTLVHHLKVNLFG